MGPSGSGKTTICSLLPRFYDVTAGRITIDDQDIRHLTLKSLRSQIGMVQQDVYLFSGTIRDNIAYGKPDASDEEIIAAAKRANIHDFIMELPQQYETFVGERGARLSGGQKAVSIARVFLKNPPILILDEATSALDNESERKIEKSLEELSKTAQRSPSLIVFPRSKVLMRSSSSPKMELQSVERMSFSCKKAELRQILSDVRKIDGNAALFLWRGAFLYFCIPGYEEIIYNAEICAISTKKKRYYYIYQNNIAYVFCDKYLT